MGPLHPHARGSMPRGREMVELAKVIHQALADFQWLAEDLSKRPTRLYEIVLIQPTLYSYHDAFGFMCVGAVLLGPVPNAT